MTTMRQKIIVLSIVTASFTQACGPSAEIDSVSAEKIESVVCLYPAEFGLPGSSTMLYQRDEGTVTVTQSTAGNSNALISSLKTSQKSELDKKIDAIDMSKILPKYNSEVPATVLDGSIVSLTSTSAARSVTTSINTNDPSFLPEGIRYIFNFCEDGLYAE